MTNPELRLLQGSVDRVVALQIGGETVLALVLFVFSEGETPDVFYMEMKRTVDGSLLPVGGNGHSTLLSEIEAVFAMPDPSPHPVPDP